MGHSVRLVRINKQADLLCSKLKSFQLLYYFKSPCSDRCIPTSYNVYVHLPN